ncbi:hypothetical protein BHM03_00029105 [Ensete ventricosum]|nr:hypothetical protein BHM03_00029105 [Ensete ventricosum]
MFNLANMKSASGAASRVVPLFAVDVPPPSTMEHPTSGVEKRQRAHLDKGKGLTEVEKVPDHGYSLRELCEVDNRAGDDRYFTIRMSEMPQVEGEEPLAARWSSLSRSTRVWTKGPLATEYVRGGLYPFLAKQLYECSSKELMDRTAKSAVWVSVGLDRVMARKFSSNSLREREGERESPPHSNVVGDIYTYQVEGARTATFNELGAFKLNWGMALCQMMPSLTSGASIGGVDDRGHDPQVINMFSGLTRPNCRATKVVVQTDMLRLTGRDDVVTQVILELLG